MTSTRQKLPLEAPAIAGELDGRQLGADADPEAPAIAGDVAGRQLAAGEGPDAQAIASDVAGRQLAAGEGTKVAWPAGELLCGPSVDRPGGQY